MEIFREIRGYENTYQISDSGKVWSMRSEKFLSPNCDKYGYLYHVFCVNGIRKTVKVHRLVADAFIPNPEKKKTVDHINGDRKDNRVCNLRWATNKEQSNNPITYKKLASRDSKERMQEIGKIRNFGRKTVDVYKDGEFLGRFGSLLLAAQTYHVNYSKASECANGKRNHTGNYKFCWVTGL